MGGRDTEGHRKLNPAGCWDVEKGKLKVVSEQEWVEGNMA